MITFLVDHPQRDLECILDITKDILNQGRFKKICITTTINLDEFLFSDAFKNSKMIVFNYFRDNYVQKIKYCSNKGKINIIYDTEGAPGNDGLQLTSIIERNKDYIKYIDQYIFWGEAQMNDVVKKLSPSFKSGVGGYIRYKKVSSRDKKFILINTNFASISPKFNKSANKEYEDALKIGLISKKQIVEELAEINERKKKFLEILSVIFREFPNKSFVIRPHPFEDDEVYYKLCLKYKNVKLDNNLSSSETLQNAKLLIHLDCTTAIEAYYMKVPILNLHWIKREHKYVFNLANNIGHKSESISDAIDYIKSDSYDQTYVHDKKIEYFFGKENKNKNKNFLDILNELQKKSKKKQLFELLPMKTYLKFLIRKILPEKLYINLIAKIKGKFFFEALKSKTINISMIQKKISKEIKILKKGNIFYLQKRENAKKYF